MEFQHNYALDRGSTRAAKSRPRTCNTGSRASSPAFRRATRTKILYRFVP
jgi:hypothetical protein